MEFVDAGTPISEMVNIGIAIALILASIFSIFYIGKGGFLYIMSSGDEEKIKEAVHTIRYSIVGILVIFFSIFVIKIIGSLFGFDFLSYISMEKIKELTFTIMEKLKGNPVNHELKGVLDY